MWQFCKKLSIFTNPKKGRSQDLCNIRGETVPLPNLGYVTPPPLIYQYLIDSVVTSLVDVCKCINFRHWNATKCREMLLLFWKSLFARLICVWLLWNLDRPYTGHFLCIFILCKGAKKISKSLQQQAKKILIIKMT